MEKARAAFATAAGLEQVQVAAVPGLRDMLQVRAALAHDWERTAAAMAARSWWFEKLRADDVAANVRSELAAQLAAAEADPEAHRRAWMVLGTMEARLLAERCVLHELEQLVATRAVLWDPRLDEVAAAAAALRAFWTGVAPALPREPEGPPVNVPFAAPPPAAALCDRVREALAAGDGTAAPAQLLAARECIGTLATRWWAVQLLCHRVAQTCATVRDHASRRAERTQAPDRRQAYRELARRCADMVAALELLRGR